MTTAPLVLLAIAAALLLVGLVSLWRAHQDTYRDGPQHGGQDRSR